ncbi:MAG: hypothetical protein KDE22_19085 [Rhodobacterales bacterium]|nr:hypothetical protein [Rhodobacterales bacterium]
MTPPSDDTDKPVLAGIERFGDDQLRMVLEAAKTRGDTKVIVQIQAELARRAAAKG